jgi:hypothetical protein
MKKHLPTYKVMGTYFSQFNCDDITWGLEILSQSSCCEKTEMIINQSSTSNTSHVHTYGLLLLVREQIGLIRLFNTTKGKSHCLEISSSKDIADKLTFNWVRRGFFKALSINRNLSHLQ